MRRMNGLIAVLGGVWLAAPLAAPAGGKVAPAVRPPATPAVSHQVAALVDAFEQTTSATAGVSVVDLRTGQTLFAHRPDEPMVPASNQKLLTSVFALLRLGGAFHFTTGVFQAGQDIIVVGDGDPTLGDPYLAELTGRGIYADLDRWSAAIAAATGGSIRDILLCVGVGARYRPRDWPANQKTSWYAAPVACLNFHNNCLDITFQAAAGGGIQPIIRPESRYFRFANRLAAGANHVWSFQATGNDATFTLAGTISRPTNDPTSVAVDNPPLLLGRVLAERLIRAGVKITGQIREVPPDAVEWCKAEPLAATRTTLAAAMARANKRSLNMAAEAIFLRAGDGTWEGSAEMMRQTLARAYAIPPDRLIVCDGGGLSRDNRVAASAVTALLAGAAIRRDALVFLTSLSIGGVDGTLEHRLTTPPCKGRVLAKTGYIAGVSSLSGYILDDSRRVTIAFAILINRLPGDRLSQARGLQDSICRVLIDSITPLPETKAKQASSSR